MYRSADPGLEEDGQVDMVSDACGSSLHFLSILTLSFLDHCHLAFD